MKLLFIFFAILIASSMGKLIKINKNAGRTSSPETVDFQVHYLGTCDQFFSISPVTVSALPTTGANAGCLPLNIATGVVTDDLQAHVLCTNIGRNRAQIDFVEIFVTDENVPYPDGFAISFTPNRPFRALNSGVTYIRRPSCTTQQDFCSTTNYVHSCTENIAATRRGYVISNDQIFIIRDQHTAVGCGTGVSSCCGYLTANGATPFCPRAAPTANLTFDWDHHHDHDDDDHHHGHGNGNHGHGNGNHGHGNDNHYDDDDDDHHHGHGNGNHGHGNGNHGHGNGHGNGNHGHGHHGHKEEENNNTNNVVQVDEDDKKKK